MDFHSQNVLNLDLNLVPFRTGPALSYTKEGLPKQFVEFNNEGLKHGKLKEFHNGKIKLQIQYENGVKNGPWIVFDENGTIQSTEHYLNGELVKKSPSSKK